MLILFVFSLFISFNTFLQVYLERGMGLGFDNVVILAISRDSYFRSEVNIECFRMTVVELFLLLLIAIS